MQGGESKSQRQNVRRETDVRVIRCSTLKGRGGRRDNPHQGRYITEKLSSRNRGFNCWKVLGAEIIKLIITFKGFLYTKHSRLYILSHMLPNIILIPTL